MTTRVPGEKRGVDVGAGEQAEARNIVEAAMTARAIETGRVVMLFHLLVQRACAAAAFRCSVVLSSLSFTVYSHHDC